jgi:NADH-quinone oxidoreductase subunit F
MTTNESLSGLPPRGINENSRVLLTETLPDPTDAGAYIREQQGYSGLERARSLAPDALIGEIKSSGLRGRGGAAFNLGQKLASVSGAKPVYMIVNLDEGEPGTFKDRILCEQHPHKVLEGAAICAQAAGAERIYIYCRVEYTFLQEYLQAAMDSAYACGALPPDLFTIRLGAGAYICGEETALIDSLEGRRGYPRYKPPFPTQYGLWGQPTIVSNVETLANLPYILRHGAAAYAALGQPDYPGTKLICLSGDVKRTGCFELPTDYLLRDVIYTWGEGVREDKNILAVQVGGSSGAVITSDDLDLPMSHTAMRARGLTLGSGAVLVLDETRDILDLAFALTRFFEYESCGKCTPCREGTFRVRRVIEKLMYREAATEDLERLVLLLEVMRDASLCGLGQSVHTALYSMITHFPDWFWGRVIDKEGGM